MAFCLECIIFFVAVLSGLVGVVYIYFNRIYTYWKIRNIPFVPATVPFGNIKDVIYRRTSLNEAFAQLYRRLEGHKYGGVFQFHRPTLLLRDPEVIKQFITKDANSFHDRGVHFDEENDPVSAHIFNLPGQKWRNVRAKLTPTFTSGKIKMMFQTVLDCGQEMKDVLKESGTRGETIEVSDIVARYAPDVIASCAFGVQCNSIKNPNDVFRLKWSEFFDPGLKFSVGFLMNFMAPSLAAKLSWGRIPVHLSKFFRDIVKETVEYREKNNVARNDFMHLLIQLKNKGYVDVDVEKDSVEISTEAQSNAMRKLTLDEITAQAFIFFLGGFETSSSVMSCCLYELALNPDIQSRLQLELDKVLENHGGRVTYDAVQEMEYLHQVVQETLRKYPPLSVLNRVCTAAYKLPDSDVVLEPGTPVVVPVLALHHDPLYFPEPDRFDPERFTQEAKTARHHYTYLPFGEGPRNCIGMRFGSLQTKIGLISLLASYDVRVSDKTTIPMTLDPIKFTLCPKGGVFLQIVKRL